MRLLRDSGTGSPPDRIGGVGFSVVQACVCTVVQRGVPWGPVRCAGKMGPGDTGRVLGKSWAPKPLSGLRLLSVSTRHPRPLS